MSKKLKLLLTTLTSFIFVILISLSLSGFSIINAQTDPGEDDDEEEIKCGLCVTPSSSYPYPDETSSYETTGCLAC